MTHIQQRRDQSAVWTATDPVLYEGEAGHEDDTGKWKIGDGVTPWTALPYKGGVDSVAGKTGEVDLVVADVIGAAPLDSPTFTGAPTAPTPSTADNDTTVATTAFVQAAIDAAITEAMAPTIAAVKMEMFPVGSLYFSEDGAHPGDFIGGTWEPYAGGRTIVGVDPILPDYAGPGFEGGVEQRTLNTNHLPAHSHTQVVTLDMTSPAGALRSTVVGGGAVWSESDGVQINSAGEGDQFSIMQPYVTCYIWKRVT